MKLINIDVSKQFILIPREFVTSSTANLTLRNELTKVEETHEVALGYSDGYYTLDLSDFTLVLTNKYSFTLVDDTPTVLFKGKVFIIDNEVDVQDYKLTKITNNKLYF